LQNNIVNLERALVFSAYDDNAVLGYLINRLTAKDLTDQASKSAWAALSAGKQPPDKAVQALQGSTVLTVIDAKDAVKTLKTSVVLRKVYQICAHALKGLQNGAAKNPEEFITRFSKAAAQIALPTSADDCVKAPAEWLDGAYKEIQARRNEKRPRWLDLGIPTLTDALAAEPGHLVILAAETGKGKTALALNIATYLSVNQSIPSLYCNTEMGWEELAFRIYALMADVNLFQMRAGCSSQDDFRKIEKARKAKQVGNSLYITDALPWATTDNICSLAREYAVTIGLKVLFVDYVQRLEIKDGNEQWLGLLSAAKDFKSLAQELGIMVLMVAQLNRQEQLAGSSGMARECDAWANLEELPPEEKATQNTVATHRIKIKKSRHTCGGNSIDILMQSESLRMFEVSTGAAGIGDIPVKHVDAPLSLLPEEWRTPDSSAGE
jgi:hypothetical protein